MLPKPYNVHDSKNLKERFLNINLGSRTSTPGFLFFILLISIQITFNRIQSIKGQKASQRKLFTSQAKASTPYHGPFTSMIVKYLNVIQPNKIISLLCKIRIFIIYSYIVEIN